MEINLAQEEREMLIKALEYFRKAEEREIRELSLPGGNKEYIPSCQERLRIFESLIQKFSG
jgi:hypothetical protein